MHNDIALFSNLKFEPSAKTASSASLEEFRAGFREAMSRVPSAVYLITSDGEAGRCGIMATAVLAVSVEPPTMLISVDRSSVSAQQLIANGKFCVNLLKADDELLAEVFAGRTDLQRDARYSVGHWHTLETGSPVLCSARAVFDCKLVASLDAATHQLLVGEVVGVESTLSPEGEEEALLYMERGYKTV